MFLHSFRTSEPPLTSQGSATSDELASLVAPHAQKETFFYRILEFLAAHDGVDSLAIRRLGRALSQKEWEEKRVSQPTMEALDLKGSPKLSKQLIGMGIPINLVLIALSAPSIPYQWVSDTRVIAEGIEDLRDQGNSIHYNSCQATDLRSRGGVDPSLVKIDGDVPHFGKTLFLWVSGDRMSVNNEGFKARAKLRVMYENDQCQNVAGLFIDSVYGQQGLLLRDITGLKRWWDIWSRDHNMPETPLLVRTSSFPEIPVERKVDPGLYCPSAESGYQDLMQMGAVTRMSLHALAVDQSYPSLVKERLNLTRETVTTRFTGDSREYVQHVLPHSAVRYNPQRRNVLSVVGKDPRVTERSWRGPIPVNFHEHLQGLFKVFGFPRADIRVSFCQWEDSYQTVTNVSYVSKTDNCITARFDKRHGATSLISLLVSPNSKRELESILIVDRSIGGVVIESDLPEYGFYKAKPIMPTVHFARGNGMLVEYKGSYYLAVREIAKGVRLIKALGEEPSHAIHGWREYLTSPFKTVSAHTDSLYCRFIAAFDEVRLRVNRFISGIFGFANEEIPRRAQMRSLDPALVRFDQKLSNSSRGA